MNHFICKIFIVFIHFIFYKYINRAHNEGFTFLLRIYLTLKKVMSEISRWFFIGEEFCCTEYFRKITVNFLRYIFWLLQILKIFYDSSIIICRFKMHVLKAKFLGQDLSLWAHLSRGLNEQKLKRNILKWLEKRFFFVYCTDSQVRKVFQCSLVT